MPACTGSACDFAREYELASSHVLLAIEREVQGCDYGATSWTTLAQARTGAQALRLRPGMRLLEIGAGAGWPALLMAGECACDAVLTDLPLSALYAARVRARRDGIEARCTFASASGAALPFAAGAFDAIGHSDVLCCMTGKRRMLRECRRVAREGARMAFWVIRLARPARNAPERELLLGSGPPWPGTRAPYGDLLRAAGWTVLESCDITAEFERCMRVLLQQSEVHAAALAAVLGTAELAARLQRRRSTLEALGRGLLRREFYLAA